MNSDHLEKELEWFEANKEELFKKYKGKWAVIHHQQLIGIYDSFTEGAVKGSDKANSDRILVKHVVQEDDIEEPSINLTLGLFHESRPSEPL
ncbi:MAG: hypothetical protein KKH67_04650 [candidate division Zixibacteria bacterium]|nr:hypothetical protein [candidate division Zixibacteria bacterium]MBU1471178.1 hypothetical protein [candidate division Zixibacteria bacterium]